jgi:hypothetical protein
MFYSVHCFLIDLKKIELFLLLSKKVQKQLQLDAAALEVGDEIAVI